MLKMCIRDSFGTAEHFGGICNLRMDDTNPTKEDVEYIDAIKEDIKWLGYDSVSYTHLDVYKRQALYSAPPLLFG